MYRTKTLGFTVHADGLRAEMRDDDLATVGELRGTVPENVIALADAIRERYNAPLIILGRVEELRTVPVFGSLTTQHPQWRVIHEGERKLMTREEVMDLVFAMEFVEDSK